MSSQAYLRPIGRISGPLRQAAGEPNRPLLIGTAGGVAFAALERIERWPGAGVERRFISAAEAREEAARDIGHAADVRAALAGFAAPRSDIAGLELDRPRIMGIVNVTPDSFSDGGNHAGTRQAIDFARQLVDEGAELLDIGGESTRPGSDAVPVEEELRRVLPVIEALSGNVSARISVDTRKAEVMRRAAAAGAHLINDVAALQFEPECLDVAAETGLPVVLMHARGDPKTMQQDPRYDNALLDVFDELAERVDACVSAGIPREKIVLDPGIGFAKTIAHNLELLAGLAILHGLGAPVLLGASRKTTIGKLTGVAEPAARMPGSVSAALSGAMQGATILRVHDVAATRQALTVWEASLSGEAPAIDG